MAKQDQNGPQISAWMGEKPSRTKQKKKKSFLLQQLDILDRKVESTLLSPQELEHKCVLSVEPSGLLREEELYWL